MVLPASVELASPPYQSGDLPHDREERIGARSIELNGISPGTNRRLFQLSYAGMRAPGLPGSRLRKLVLAAGVEPTTSRLRSACTAVVLRQQSSFRLAGNQRPRGLYRPRERLMRRGAQPENSLIHV